MSLLIDDGDKKRKNRELFFRENWRHVGVAVGRLRYRQEFNVVVYLFTRNVIKSD